MNDLNITILRVELSLNSKMFIEPQQRFTVRKGTTTIGTGVFTTLLPPRTDAERDPKLKKKLMKVGCLFVSRTIVVFNSFAL